MSGLLLCGECGAPYRRITRHSGEVVWRCANRVEHGKAICKTASAVTEEALNQFLLEMKVDAGKIRKQGVIKVYADGCLGVISPQLEMAISPLIQIVTEAFLYYAVEK